MKQYYFLSGMQRAGSTLLGSLLNQNHNVYVSPTSPLLDLICLSEVNLQDLFKQYTFNHKEVSKNIGKSIFENFYNHINKPIIIDKHRGWPKNLNNVKNILNVEPKVICTYRPMAQIVASFIKLADKDPNNAIDVDLKKYRKEINNRNRAEYVWENWILEIYNSFKHGLINNRNLIHVVHYDDLISDPQTTLQNIYKFLDLEPFEHRFDNIENTCAEQKDEIWGFVGLHDVRPTIQKQSLDPTTILDSDLIEYFKIYDNFLPI